MLIRFLLGMFLALSSCLVGAQTTTPTYEYQPLSCVTIGQTPTQWSEKNLATWLAQSPSYAGSYLSVPGAFTGTTTIYCSGTIARMFNGAANGSGGMSTLAICDTANGWQIFAADKVCRRQVYAPNCVAGDKFQVTWADGWYASSTSTSPTGGFTPENLPPTTACSAQCQGGQVELISCHRSTVAHSSGAYAGTCTFEFTKTGANCTTPTADPNANTPPPTGETPPPPPPTDPPTDPTGGTGTGGTGGTGTGGTGGDPTPTPPTCGGEGQAACPTGGTTGTGNGSGTTTCGGTGQPACVTTCGGTGQPVCSTTCGGTGQPLCTGTAGTTPSDAKPVCGGPGLPACSVTVSENPLSDAGYKAAVEATGKTLDDSVKENGAFWGTVKSYVDKSAQELTGWTWTFSLPTGCVPYAMAAYGFSIDVCQFQPMIHDIMGFLWVLLTIAGLVRLFVWGID